MRDIDNNMFIDLLKEKISNLKNTLVERERYNFTLREENIKLKNELEKYDIVVPEGIKIKQKSDAEYYAKDPLAEGKHE